MKDNRGFSFKNRNKPKQPKYRDPCSQLRSNLQETSKDKHLGWFTGHNGTNSSDSIKAIYGIFQPLSKLGVTPYGEMEDNNSMWHNAIVNGDIEIVPIDDNNKKGFQFKIKSKALEMNEESISRDFIYKQENTWDRLYNNTSRKKKIEFENQYDERDLNIILNNLQIIKPDQYEIKHVNNYYASVLEKGINDIDSANFDYNHDHAMSRTFLPSSSNKKRRSKPFSNASNKIITADNIINDYKSLISDIFKLEIEDDEEKNKLEEAKKQFLIRLLTYKDDEKVIQDAHNKGKTDVAAVTVVQDNSNKEGRNEYFHIKKSDIEAIKNTIKNTAELNIEDNELLKYLNIEKDDGDKYKISKDNIEASKGIVSEIYYDAECRESAYKKIGLTAAQKEIEQKLTQQENKNQKFSIIPVDLPAGGGKSYFMDEYVKKQYPNVIQFNRQQLYTKLQENNADVKKYIVEELKKAAGTNPDLIIAVDEINATDDDQNLKEIMGYFYIPELYSETKNVKSVSLLAICANPNQNRFKDSEYDNEYREKEYLEELEILKTKIPGVKTNLSTNQDKPYIAFLFDDQIEVKGNELTQIANSHLKSFIANKLNNNKPTTYLMVSKEPSIIYKYEDNNLTLINDDDDWFKISKDEASSKINNANVVLCYGKHNKIGGDFEHFSNDLCKDSTHNTYKIYNSPINNAAELYQLDKRDRSGKVEDIYFSEDNNKNDITKYLDEEINRINNNIASLDKNKEKITRTTQLLKKGNPLALLKGKIFEHQKQENNEEISKTASNAKKKIEELDKIVERISNSLNNNLEEKDKLFLALITNNPTKEQTFKSQDIAVKLLELDSNLEVAYLKTAIKKKIRRKRKQSSKLKNQSIYNFS